MNRAIRKIMFPGAQGHQLAARLDLPPDEPRAYAVFAHCFTCSKDIAAASRISAGLVADGFGVLRFDFTGIGSSEGEFANTNFSSNVDDLVCAADWLAEHHAAPTLLVGHSLGGAAVIAAAERLDHVAAVATIGAPSDPAHVSGLLSPTELSQIAAEGEAEVLLAGRPFTITDQFLDDISRRKIEGCLADLDAALLVMHSPVDNVVSIDHAAAIYGAARHPKSFVSLDGADHLLSDRADAAYAAAILSAWATKYVPRLPDEADDPAHPRTDRGIVIVEEAGTGDFAQRVHAGPHTIIADEPPGIGDDTGPTPYDLLLSALGTCTSMTLRMYANRKKLPLDHVRVTLTHERTHADDCAEPETAPCRVEVLSREIEVFGDLDDAQRAKLLEIADKCPVHRTLEGDLRIRTELV